MSEFIIDLDENSFDAIARIQYRLQDGKIADFFADCPSNLNLESRKDFFKKMKERIPKYYWGRLYCGRFIHKETGSVPQAVQRAGALQQAIS